MSSVTTDALERIFWTCVQAVVAILIVEIGDLQVWWAPIVMAVLVTIKTAVAPLIGNRDAAIMPWRPPHPPTIEG